jgi:hypothetical protein
MNHAAVWTEYRAEDEVRAIYGAAQALGAYADFRGIGAHPQRGVPLCRHLVGATLSVNARALNCAE